MLKLKTPKTKEVVGNVTNTLSLGVGAMASRGLLSFVDPDKNGKKTMAKLGITLGSVGAASAIKGTSQTAKLVQLGLIGMAVMQGVDLLSEQISEQITMKAEPSKLENFGYAALGLGCACQGGLGNPYGWPALMQPTIEAIEYNREFAPGRSSEVEYAEFENLPAGF